LLPPLFADVKISTLARKVCHVSGPVYVGEPNSCVRSGWSRCPSCPVCGTAGQFSAMNSCHAKAAACDRLGDPGRSVGTWYETVMVGAGGSAGAGSAAPTRGTAAARIAADETTPRVSFHIVFMVVSF